MLEALEMECYINRGADLEIGVNKVFDTVEVYYRNVCKLSLLLRIIIIILLFLCGGFDAFGGVQHTNKRTLHAMN